MKESLWGYWIVVLGVSIMGVMLLLQNYTTTNEQDYYLVKEVLEASMYEAVDYGYYRDTGELKMNAEKFTENFIRRFSEVVNINKKYTLSFYDIYEEPPAASVSISTTTNDTAFGQNQSANKDKAAVVNRLTGILYTNSKYQPRL
ncbi:MAG: DUF5411 family protein [Bacilli bacterium]|nr:DUF5411 family protein [Bacilli bacterium]